MYIWLSLNVDEYFKNIKETVKSVKQNLGISYGNESLPWHISLKMPFLVPVGQEVDIIEDIEKIYNSLTKFTLEIKSIEFEKNILWIRYKDNKKLESIGESLNAMLKNKYNISYHEYDFNYKYHTTLFMNDNENIIREGYLLLKNELLPNEIHINKFFIGYSLDGKSNTWKILKEISIQSK